MTPSEKAKIFQEMKQILSLREPPSKERKNLINYYKLMKDDADFIKEAKKHDSYYWLASLEEAYSACDKQHYEGTALDRKIEKLMIVLKEDLLDKAYEFIEPFQ